jgi:glucose/arabinose dehydrogenase
MSKRSIVFSVILGFGLLFGLFLASGGGTAPAQDPSIGYGPNPELPPPDQSLIPVVNPPNAVGWGEGQKPVAAEGMEVAAFAADLDHPRWLYVLPNGDVLVAETNAPERRTDRPSRTDSAC